MIGETAEAVCFQAICSSEYVNKIVGGWIGQGFGFWQTNIFLSFLFISNGTVDVSMH